MMRIKRDYNATIRRALIWIKTRRKPLAVIVCGAMFNEIWDQIKKERQKNEVKKWFVTTPENIGFFKADFNIKKSKEFISKTLEARYNWLKSKGEKIELCVYLSQVIDNMSYEEQKELILNSIEWLRKKIKINPTEITFGWDAYNEDTLKICKEYNLKPIFPEDYNFTHDYFILVDRVKLTN